MFCAKCGASNEDTSVFCYKCGAKLVQISENPVVEPVVEQPAPAPEQDNQVFSKPVSHSNRKKIANTVSSVVLVVLIVVIIVATNTNLFSGLGLGGSAKITFTSDFEETYSGGGPFIIEHSGTVWSVQSGGYIVQRFGNTVPFSVSGTFSSSMSVTAFIVSESVWNTVNLTDHGNVAMTDLSPYELTTGSVSSGSLSVDLAAGQHYIVIFV